MANNNERKTWIMYRKVYKGIALNSLPIGTLVKDTSSTFLGAPIIWKVADINHAGYPVNSITLITERIVAIRPFDVKEPNNSLASPRSYGNPVYAWSNVRQWLNSDAEAGQWYTAQHSADQAPTSEMIQYNSYAEDAGFLNGFSEQFKNALLTTPLITRKYTTAETLMDKIFLPSTTEVLGTSRHGVVEGSLLQLFKTTNNRIAYVTAEAIADSDYKPSNLNTNKAWYWWTRTSHDAIANSQSGSEITAGGVYAGSTVHGYSRGIRPLCNLPSTVRVSETPDEKGVYTIVQF